MPISECSYCGALTITDDKVCTACAMLIEVPNSPSPGVQPPPVADAEPVDQQFGQSAPLPYPGSSASPPRRDNFGTEIVVENTGTCIRCGAAIPPQFRTCEVCPKKKGSFGKKFAVVGVLCVIGYFIFNFGYQYVSPRGLVRNYEKATNSSADVDSFMIKGEVTVSAVQAFGLSDSVDAEIAKDRNGERSDFRMAFQTPGKSAVEMTRGKSIVFKEVYDGQSGWSIDGPNAAIQNKNDGFRFKRMGVGIDDYDSMEFLDKASEESFAVGQLKIIKARRTVNVGNEKLTISEMVFVRGVVTRNGSSEQTVLAFDRGSRMLLGMATSSKFDGKELASVILFDGYRRFPFKTTGLSSLLGSNQIMIPTKWLVVVGNGVTPQNPLAASVVMTFDVKDVDSIGGVDPAIFQRPTP